MKNVQIFKLTNYRESPLVRSKSTNPFKKTGNLRQVYEKQFEETNRGRKIIHYKSKFKKKKKINKSKYDNSRSSPNDNQNQETTT